MKDNILLTEEKEQVALLTLNRPEVMNALNFSLLYALKEQIEALQIRSDIRVIIITGAGDKAFCAGADLKERATLNPAQVKEFIFTGRRVMAEEALQINLVNHTCESALLIEECQKMAAMICETGPIAIEQAKYAINYGLETDLQTGLAIESNAYWVTIPTEDRLEALAAFGEKRKPVFKGK